MTSIITSFLNVSNLIHNPTVTGTDKVFWAVGILTAAIGLIINTVTVPWLTLKTIAYFRHRRSVEAEADLVGGHDWEDFNFGFNLKPL
ncbi:MAG: hypothetical protein Q9210_002949 [Variospora velana]